jgi:WD40 repeat protein
LPEPYRQPLILCYLENRPQAEAARLLGLSPAVLRGRLERGRQSLRRRLERLGLPLAAALLLTDAGPVPAALAMATLRTASGGPVPSAVAGLIAGGSLLSPYKTAVAAVILLAAGGWGVSTANRRAEPAAAPPPSKSPEVVRGAVDALGDPLPPGAVRRLGTVRHRVQLTTLPWQGLPDGKSYLIVQNLGGLDHEVRRVDGATGRVLDIWPVPATYQPLAFSPDGKYFLKATRFTFYGGAGPSDEREWVLSLDDLGRRQEVWRNRERPKPEEWKHVELARFSPDGKWIAATGVNGHGSLSLWDAATGKELWSRAQSRPGLYPLGFADGGDTLVLRGGDAIELFDRATGRRRRSVPLPELKEHCTCVLAPEGTAVLYGTFGPAVGVWDLATGKKRPALSGHRQEAHRFAFSPDGKTLVTAGADPFAMVRAWPSGEEVRRIDWGQGRLQWMRVSGDGRRLEALLWDEEFLRIYDLKTGKDLSPPRPAGHPAGVWGLATGPGGTLLSLGRDGTVLTWDPASGREVGSAAVEKAQGGGGFAVSRDGRLMATPDTEQLFVHLYDRVKGKPAGKLPAEREALKDLAFSPDGRWLAGSGAADAAVRVWEVATGRVALRVVDKTILYGVACAFSPDGRQFAVSGEGVVRFWEVGTWKELAGMKGRGPLGLAYSPDGRTLAAANPDGVRLFELATRRERAHLTPRDFPWGRLRFAPDGRWLAWQAGPRTFHVWDVHRGEPLGSFTGHDGGLTDLAFTADGRGLASSSADATILIWDVAGAAAKKPAPKAGDVEEAWRALSREDPEAAFRAVGVLASSPGAAVPLLSRHLKPVAPIDAKRLETCLLALDSTEFADRERATQELGKMGDQAAAALERFLAGRPSVEARRRAEQALEQARELTGERLAEMRALEALERMGGDGARRLMELLAKAAPDAGLTRDAGAALGRMKRQPER